MGRWEWRLRGLPGRGGSGASLERAKQKKGKGTQGRGFGVYKGLMGSRPRGEWGQWATGAIRERQ